VGVDRRPGREHLQLLEPRRARGGNPSPGASKKLEIIHTGDIRYTKAEIHEVSANVIGTTAIVLNKVTQLAAVGGHEATNLFEVIEAYAQEADGWKMVALTFTKLLTPDDQPPAQPTN
jgi:hypothetical protein